MQDAFADARTLAYAAEYANFRADVLAGAGDFAAQARAQAAEQAEHEASQARIAALDAALDAPAAAGPRRHSDEASDATALAARAAAKARAARDRAASAFAAMARHRDVTLAESVAADDGAPRVRELAQERVATIMSERDAARTHAAYASMACKAARDDPVRHLLGLHCIDADRAAYGAAYYASCACGNYTPR